MKDYLFFLHLSTCGFYGTNGIHARSICGLPTLQFIDKTQYDINFSRDKISVNSKENKRCAS